jgi:molybdate transport system ATP-binding protein
VIELRIRARLVDLDLKSDAHVLCLFGPSGSGKTTCLEAIAGLLRPDEGRIVIGGEVLTHLPPRSRRVGYLPQDAPLFPHLSVRENLVYGAPGADPSEIAEALGVSDLLGRPARRLSGGEQRRVALGRALLIRPRILLLDEPFGGLEAPLRARLLTNLAQVDVPHILLVTHDAQDALGLADEVVRLDEGRAVERGAPDTLFGPRSELVEPAALLVGTIESRNPPHAEIVCGEMRLAAFLPAARDGERVRVAIRADEVTLALHHHEDLSARNQIDARIVELSPHGEQVLATLDAGARLYARLDKRSAESLELAPGSRVVAQFKATAVRRAGTT